MATQTQAFDHEEEHFLAAKSGASIRSIRRVNQGLPVRASVRERIAKAAVALGIQHKIPEAPRTDGTRANSWGALLRDSYAHTPTDRPTGPRMGNTMSQLEMRAYIRSMQGLPVGEEPEVDPEEVEIESRRERSADELLNGAWHHLHPEDPRHFGTMSPTERAEALPEILALLNPPTAAPVEPVATPTPPLAAPPAVAAVRAHQPAKHAASARLDSAAPTTRDAHRK